MATCFISNSSPLISPYKSPLSSTSNGYLGYPTSQSISKIRSKGVKHCRKSSKTSTPSTSGFRVRCELLPVDPWAPSIDSQSIASQLFAASLFPYLGFLYFITKSKTAPKLTLVGFYFLLAFVGATSTFLCPVYILYIKFWWNACLIYLLSEFLCYFVLGLFRGSCCDDNCIKFYPTLEVDYFWSCVYLARDVEYKVFIVAREVKMHFLFFLFSLLVST